MAWEFDVYFSTVYREEEQPHDIRRIVPYSLQLGVYSPYALLIHYC